jgi:squalene-hopene/tetraprenyl-beta-curcumene cyclase
MKMNKSARRDVYWGNKEERFVIMKHRFMSSGLGAGLLFLCVLLALTGACRRADRQSRGGEASPSAAAASADAVPVQPRDAEVAAAPAAPEPSDLERRARTSLDRGLDYLLRQQQTNGVWSNAQFPALSALPLWAMAIAARPRDTEAIGRTAAYVSGCAQPDGGIYVSVPGRRGGSLGTYNTAICMTALHALGRPEYVRPIQKARGYVAETQLLGDDEYRGGFGYEKNSGQPYADLNNTAWALSAMRVTQDVEESRPDGEARVDVNWDAALAYVNKMQLGTNTANADDAGGFIYKPEDPNKAGVATNAAGRPYLRSFGSITYSGLLSLIYAQVARSDPRVVSAVEYARRHWTVGENPGMGQQGLYYYYTIMARSLATTGLKTLPALEGGQPVPWRDELLERILSLQQEDGSWVNSNNRFWENDPVLATAYALLAIEYSLGMAP